MTILVNDGISKGGIKAMEEAGFEVRNVHVAQEQLQNYINEHKVNALLVRSATKVRKDIIDNCPTLKVIGRGGVGMDNIDVDYALKNGVEVINTPAAASGSVAELVFAHLFSGVRFLHDSNRNMPLEGDSRFKDLKKRYSAGKELRGKALGIIGFGKIGREVAKIALGCGMKVVASDSNSGKADIKLSFFDGQSVTLEIRTEPIEKLIKESDFISLHVPAQSGYLIGKDEISKMKDGVGIINAARGGVLHEVALLEAIESGKVSFAALDVFEGEPSPSVQVLMNESVSLSPHIGASTLEAQDRIGLELAEQIIKIFNKK
ncbi:D-2-hydroxyacid dehydrogenase [Aequorivita viscosa]|uniref:D-3-phosphoglycerate dehydrogenase n=1 Tax=Aequorivita viscosa TaxID=797419 RepID=A0A1M6N8M3_9FLAO|nr:D-2-hydroxyacid dehydrogenase [Aequorivita viscosa]SDX44236.1 D-3-phosphoglycerate dehydrogenase [Aequorivita viscosa]SHJ92059.1 D-3-phosphoglycerate dehydrogenase [Aequorivita viscosa]